MNGLAKAGTEGQALYKAYRQGQEASGPAGGSSLSYRYTSPKKEATRAAVHVLSCVCHYYYIDFCVWCVSVSCRVLSCVCRCVPLCCVFDGTKVHQGSFPSNFRAPTIPPTFLILGSFRHCFDAADGCRHHRACRRSTAGTPVWEYSCLPPVFTVSIVLPYRKSVVSLHTKFQISE